MRYLISIMTLASFAALPLNVSALSAEQTVQKETTAIGADGTVQTIRETIDKIVPGERIVYSLNFTNDDAAPASDIVLTMPIPSEVKFIEGTAEMPATTVTYSADGGESFASRQSVMKLDNAGNIRTASADELTHIRWTVPGPVEIGASGSLSFAATVR